MSLEDDRPHTYNTLPADHFRYVELHPGIGQDLLRCSLLTSRIEQANYEALSYVWGSEDKNKIVLCCEHAIAVTTNLHQALHRLRDPQTIRRLWVDSICINQNDLEEKANQVASMGRIFAQAQRVLIHIGTDDKKHGLLAKTLVEDVQIILGWELSKINTATWNAMPFPRHDAPILKDARWNAFFALFRQEWFSRGWVVQEAALARQGFLIWGDTELSWDDVMRVFLWTIRRANDLYQTTPSSITTMFNLLMPHMDAYVDRHVGALRPFLNEANTWTNDLADYVVGARSLRFKDPRDRIYAFLDLPFTLKGERLVIPNYRLSTLEVYKSFASHYIRATRSPSILSYVEHSLQTLRSSLPTWVPQWDSVEKTAGAAFSRDRNYASLTSRDGSVHTPDVLEDRILRVRGVILDSIWFTSETLQQSTSTLKSLLELFNVVKAPQLVTPYGNNCLEAFLATICRNLVMGDSRVWHQCKSKFFKAFERQTHSIDSFEYDAQLGGELERFVSLIAELTDGMKLIITERGYMGMAPAVTQEKDRCAILFGSQHQCFLRAVEDQHPSTFHFLGPGYILGAQIESRGGLGAAESKDWVDWDIEEQDIYLC